MVLGTDPSELTRFDPIETVENLWNQGLEGSQAIGRRFQQHDADSKALQDLLVGQVHIDGDECVVALARPLQQFAILQTGPSGFGYGHDIVV